MSEVANRDNRDMTVQTHSSKQMLSSSSTSTTTTTTTCHKRNNLNHKALSPTTTKPSHFSHLTPISISSSSNSKAMEDVWEGININLTSLNDHNTNTSKGAKFQDFLSRPFTNFSTIASADPSPPVTALTLSTRSEFHFDPLTHKDLQLGQPHHKNGSKVEPFGKPSGIKRILQSGDMRKARLMKNRESAARSRARKQENIASLVDFSISIYLAFNTFYRLRETAANQGKKGNLYRTYTAPF
ncbi:hypothetical protein JHK87_003019 [Glycine soja]|nr:hypothetical protein JHK87_003019 [Glycine soja]